VRRIVRAVNLTRLQTFVEVVRRGTFAAAADALAFTPSAVSQQMARLEAEAGAPLLARDAAGVQLTEAGRLLHAHALAIVGAVREARAGLEALRAERERRLRIGACPVAAAAVLPRALRLLRERLPGAEIVLEEACAVATARAVADGRLDVGVWVVPASFESGVVEVVLRRHPLVLAFAAEPLPDDVVLRPVAGAPEWELRAARAVGAVAAIGVQAAIEALRAAAAPPRVSTLSASG
jgi:DNA-binding transcriptional LysR family regulator